MLNFCCIRNTAKIQHCPISSKFDMWLDNNILNWFLTLKNFYRSLFSKWPPQYCKNSTCWIFEVLWWQFWKWRPVEIVQCRESIRDIIIYPHIKLWWYRTMLNFCDIVMAILQFLLVAIFKMATAIQQKFNIVRYHQNLICG
jgi:hypothetical protein